MGRGYALTLRIHCIGVKMTVDGRCCRSSDVRRSAHHGAYVPPADIQYGSIAEWRRCQV